MVIYSLQFNSDSQSCSTLCDPMNHSTPGLPVHHQFPVSTQTHVHCIGDAIQPSHPLSSPSPPAPNPNYYTKYSIFKRKYKEFSRVNLTRHSSALFSPSVQFSRSVLFDSLWPHEPQHARSPCPSPTPGVYPNPCVLYWWCHPTVSSSVIPFSSCPQSFPEWGSFQMSQLFISGRQSIGVSASTSVLPMNTQD